MLLAKGSHLTWYNIQAKRSGLYFSHELYVILISSNDRWTGFANTHTEAAVILRKCSTTEMEMFQIVENYIAFSSLNT